MSLLKKKSMSIFPFTLGIEISNQYNNEITIFINK